MKTGSGRGGCRQNNYLTSPTPSLFFDPTHNSLFHASGTELFEINARLKLASVPFRSLLFDIGHLEKSFPERIMYSEMGQSYYDWQSLHCPISNIQNIGPYLHYTQLTLVIVEPEN